MVLYSASIESLAKPVKAKGKGKKQEPVEVEEKVEAPVKEKKPPTEKQLAARAKFAENRKRKLEEAFETKKKLEEDIQAKESEIKAKEAEKLEKKRIAAEKRKAKKVSPTPPPSEADISEAVDEALKVKNPRKRKADPDEPPAWVNKFVESVIMEKSKLSAEKKPVKQVKEEAKVVAQEQWKDGFTKDRVNNEVDNHMNRLYGMIFSRK